FSKYTELVSEEINAQELQRLLGIDEVKLFDVRTPKEIQEIGKIEGSMNIPIDQMKEAFQLDEKEFGEKYGATIPKKTDKNIVFYCGSGKRSRRAIDYVKEFGYR
ncbi:uncharacterized protein TRIADDRAFT_21505, partial [Trichoplax adhaerens]